MEFTPFVWLSEFVSFSLQSYCYYIFKERKSLRLLMALLCLRNLISIATHTMPWPYFYQLYFGRILTALVALWAVADVACYPATPKWTLRVPVAFAGLLAIPYWPTNPMNGPAELEHYRLFCLGLAVFILLLHTIFLVASRQSAVLQLLLLVALVVEATGSAGMLLVGYRPQLQMFCWWVALVALGSFSRDMKLRRDPPELAAQAQSSANGAPTDVSFRLPLQSRLPHSRVFERWQE